MKHKFLSLLLLGCAALSTMAQMPVQIGVRAGVNTSKMAGDYKQPGAYNMLQNIDSRAGFVLGAVVDIPLGGHFVLQPGFFYDYRRNKYQLAYETPYSPGANLPEATMATHKNGTLTTHRFQIPALISYRFSPVKFLQVQADLGPFMEYSFGGRDSFTLSTFTGDEPAATYPKMHQDVYGKEGQFRRTDWGVKMGAALKVCGHYYVGVHYLAGMRDMARHKSTVDNFDARSWEFTLGYDF